MLECGLNLKEILAYDLDDPLLSIDEREAVIRETFKRRKQTRQIVKSKL